VSLLSTVAGMLAEAIYAQGRYEEAERLTRISEDSAGDEDVYTHVLWQSVRAKVLARQGDMTEALRLAHASAILVETTDSLHLRWHTLMSGAEVLELAGRTADAEAAAREAVRVAERKGNLVGARLGREAAERILEPPAAPTS
jgi:ATP/maltotriose-dependent transcriptional regulator MalT